MRGGVEATLIRQEKNGGVAAARNRGLKEAKGNWVVFVDGDDWLEPAFLESLHGAATREGALVSSCGFFRVSEQSGKKESFPFSLPSSGLDQFIVQFLKGEGIRVHYCCFLFSRQFLLDSGLTYHEGCTMSEDMELVFKLLSWRPQWAFVSNCLYYYCRHGTNTSDRGGQEARIRQYNDATTARLRLSRYLLERLGDNREIAHLVKYYRIPDCYLRELKLCAILKDRQGFQGLLNSKEVRQALWSSWRAAAFKPENFGKALMALLLPSLLWRHYRRKSIE